jgi:predicted nucleic acid-binding protein
MSHIINIALDYYTDFRKFEELATAILNDDGYSNIIAVGGIGDDGIDAKENKYFNDGTERTIFQYSLDKSPKQKILNTIEKLKSNRINFNNLVYVTTVLINNVGEIKADIRKKYGSDFSVEIIERNTIISRLQKDNDKLFKRYFPDIKAQLAGLSESETYFNESSKDLFQSSLLKCSLLFTFNPEAQTTRKDMFDKLILSVVVSQKEVLISEIKSFLTKQYSRDIPEDQIKSSLERLKKDKLVSENDGKILTTTKTTEVIEGNVLGINKETEVLIEDIIEKVRKTTSKPIDATALATIKANLKESLSAYFRLHGLDWVNNNKISTIDTKRNEDLIKITKANGLSNELGDLLVYALGDTLKNPTEQQAEILFKWAKAFIGLQILNLDPTLKEFQKTTFSQKTFIIDTDVLLNCIVKENDLNKTYVRLIKELKSYGCKLIIPEEVITEVLKHGDATSNYNYVKNTFGLVDESIISEQIHNVFVKGYYSGIINNTIANNTSFKKYLSNYIDENSPRSFLIDYINYYFPNTFLIQSLSKISTQAIDEDLLRRLTLSINDITRSTFKAQWRTDEENLEISRNDARMYLITYSLNQINQDVNTTILPHNNYLLTNSLRAARCGLKEGLNTSVSVKPEILISLFDQLGTFEIKSKEFLNIFENPYLAYITTDCWENIKLLIDSGVDLTGKNPVRLKYDLNDTIHEFLTTDDSDSIDDMKQNENEIKDFNQFVEKVKSKGYKFSTNIEAFLSEHETLKDDLQQQKELYNKMNEQIAIFGKRKQKYLDRIAKSNKKKK